MNRAALFSMLCSEIGIHLDSASFSEILKRREVQIHLFPYLQVTPLVYALEEIIKGLLKANSPTEETDNSSGGTGYWQDIQYGGFGFVHTWHTVQPE